MEKVVPILHVPRGTWQNCPDPSALRMQFVVALYNQSNCSKSTSFPHLNDVTTPFQILKKKIYSTQLKKETRQKGEKTLYNSAECRYYRLNKLCRRNWWFVRTSCLLPPAVLPKLGCPLPPRFCPAAREQYFLSLHLSTTLHPPLPPLHVQVSSSARLV